MNVDLLYGRKTLTVRLPDDLRVTMIGKHPMDPVREPSRAVKEALENPVGSPPLSEMARGR
ncbi:MAG: hypothetical protein H6Q81_2167, partial [Deltaproteobacteria bacterium]|nr:hypothetical protein [Deltaproteobacteria bacterium]